MEEPSLVVFGLEKFGPSLQTLLEVLQKAGNPVEIGVGIAGPASAEELATTDWEAAFVRWTEPELHEVWLIERTVREREEDAESFLKAMMQRIANHDDVAGQMIVLDHLRRTQTYYTFQLYDALYAEEDHPAWAALDVALRCLAEPSEGMIYAAAEGFYDAEGEMMLAEEETTTENL